MDMNLMTETLTIEQPLGTCQSQAVVEGDVTLNGGLREEAHVLSAGGMAVVENTEALQDRVTVSGRVVFHVLYTQGDPQRVQSVEATADFTHLCELAGAQPRSSVYADAQVEHVEARVQSGRLALRAILRISARALVQQPVEVLTGVAGGEGAQVRTQQFTMRRTVAQGSTDVLLREEFELPEGLSIRETLCATAYPVLSDVSGGLGHIGLTGQVALEAVHATDAEGHPLTVTRHTLPFEQSVEAAGENGDILQGRVTVKDVAVASQDAGDGSRTLRVEVLLGMNASADRQEAVTVLEDAYTTDGDDLRLSRRSLPCRTGDRRVHTAESGKTVLLLPDSAPSVRSMLAAFASPVVTAREQSGGRMTVEGILETTLLYMTDDSAVPVTVFQEEPFRLTFNVQAGEEDFVTLHCADIDASPITSDRVELRYVMHLTADGVTAEEVTFVTDAQPVAVSAPTQDIVLYFTQPGETLWDIARRYRVPVKGVRELNPELTGDPKTGQGVVVWRREKMA